MNVARPMARQRGASVIVTNDAGGGLPFPALQGRDRNGSLGSFEAWYDTDRNITWLADADYAQTNCSCGKQD